MRSRAWYGMGTGIDALYLDWRGEDANRAQLVVVPAELLSALREWAPVLGHATGAWGWRLFSPGGHGVLALVELPRLTDAQFARAMTVIEERLA